MICLRAAWTQSGPSTSDLIAIARQMIADPRWPEKVREGGIAEIIRCRRCDEACWGNRGKSEPVECVLWRKDELAAYMQ